MIEIQGQLPVALDLVTDDVGYDFLVGRPKTEISLMPVLETLQFRAIFNPAARFLPEFGGLHRRHQEFLGASPIHFLANDLFDFAHNAKPHGQQVVDAGRDLSDHSGAKHISMADYLGVSRSFLQRGKQEFGSAHI